MQTSNIFWYDLFLGPEVTCAGGPMGPMAPPTTPLAIWAGAAWEGGGLATAPWAGLGLEAVRGLVIAALIDAKESAWELLGSDLGGRPGGGGKKCYAHAVQVRQLIACLLLSEKGVGKFTDLPRSSTFHVMSLWLLLVSRYSLKWFYP